MSCFYLSLRKVDSKGTEGKALTLGQGDRDHRGLATSTTVGFQISGPVLGVMAGKGLDFDSFPQWRKDKWLAEIAQFGQII